MSVEEKLSELKQRIIELLPADVHISGVEFEGPELVLYTEDTQRFVDDGALVRTLAKELKKRISVRPSSNILMEPEKASKVIHEIIPEEGGIKDIYFDMDKAEVIIEAEKPGLVIGTHGATLREVAKIIGWRPNVIRAPPIESSIIKSIRRYLREEGDFRRNFMKKVGRRIYRDKLIEDDWLRVTALGGCREVGRNAFLLSTPETRILIDCGVSVGSEGMPYLYVPEVSPISNLDAVVITHAHLDHSGLVPLLFLYGYDGPIYITQPTRDLMALLLLDYIEVSAREGKKIPYKSAMIRDAIRHTIPLKYGEVTDISPDVKLTFYNAGHILGSAIAYFHMGNGYGSHNIVFTGDIKYERTFLFDPAFNAFPRPDTLVIESTYGGPNDQQPSRREAERNLKDEIERTIKRGGKVIIPAFAVGRSQEVMIALEGMQLDVPVYLDGMIWEATSVHTAYPEYLNRSLKNSIFQGENPFLSDIFVQVDDADKRKEVIEEKESSIILATSGMLNGGPVLEYLKELAADEKNTLIFVGYQAEGTLGRRIQKGWNEIQLSDAGKMRNIKIGMDIRTVDGFSGHSDRNQLIEFVRGIRPLPSKVICMHGENNKCMALASGIHKKFNIETTAPQNLETLRLV
ncbi:MAG: beta-CASP ribonuclease aCPSF1 [Methanophagales archaeon]|nr:beta-CASP ribonuclease aCPSF1 [Methanophagales archaeon]RLG35111.1 MAG: beta-CASP ribonuclease aCPSF1 [Methanosarcinales archaeon]MCW3138890.1 beta-CASP ribonuclease aCPSF1 [Methanophagales archaeon]MCW3139368.1 beta-CASP ribonuclease aCPSF1 [Methanophagales archaeon]MCW7069131.1 beta-CASP ribonuclease aCPSF1 [Methanophagales archaeon]